MLIYPDPAALLLHYIDIRAPEISKYRTDEIKRSHRCELNTEVCATLNDLIRHLRLRQVSRTTERCSVDEVDL